MADETWVIELSTPQMTTPIKITMDSPLIIGRSIPGEDSQPDIDLGPFEAADQGVSHRHLKLHSEKGQLWITDLKSTNGTQLNDQAMTPNQAYPLGNRNHLTLGKLPIDIQVVVAPTPAKGPSETAALPHHGSGELILIVEDDPEVAKVFSTVMERAGYTVKLAHEVVSAIRLFNSKRPAAVLLDLMLPHMNGVEFCRYVRRDVDLNSIPIIIVSADSAPAHRTEAMQAGADAFLSKPVTAQQLQQAVGELIAEKGKSSPQFQTKQLGDSKAAEELRPEVQENSIVLFIAGYSNAPITLLVKDVATFGRIQSAKSAKIHFDLSPFDAMESGVSRLHMKLHNKKGEFFIEDLESTNGTFRNGTRLEPHKQEQVKNGDEITLGSLKIYLYFLEHNQPSAS